MFSPYASTQIVLIIILDFGDLEIVHNASCLCELGIEVLRVLPGTRLLKIKDRSVQKIIALGPHETLHPYVDTLPEDYAEAF